MLAQSVMETELYQDRISKTLRYGAMLMISGLISLKYSSKNGQFTASARYTMIK